MLELLAYLRANYFKTYIVSGGGVDFMRPWTEKVYGIPPAGSRRGEHKRMDSGGHFRSSSKPNEIGNSFCRFRGM
jgi:hypothetical protein